MPYVDLVIEEEGHYRKGVYFPRLSVGAYREWVMTKPLMNLHLDSFVIHHHGRPETLDDSMHLTADEARELARLMVIAANQVDGADGNQ